MIEVGDKVRLVGYDTVGRVVEEQHQDGIRFLMVAWDIGGYYTAPEDGWHRVNVKPRSIWYWPLVVGLSILGTLLAYAFVVWAASR